MILLLSLFVALLLSYGAALPSHPSQVPDSTDDGFTNSTHLMKRWIHPGPPPCDDDIWDRARAKGAGLLQMMAADDATAGSLFTPPMSSAQSEFTNFPADFYKWGYSVNAETYCDMSNNQYGMEAALAGMGVSAEGRRWKCYTAHHGNPYGRQVVNDQTYVVDGRAYRATGAKLAAAINIDEGVVMITSQYSPRNSGALLPSPVTDGFPDLQKASDIAFGLWTWAAQTRTSNLRYLVLWSITNRESASIIRRALLNAGPAVRLGYYPGYTFAMESEAGKALLGSPSGVGMAFFLIQHKAQLGDKRVTHVTVFGHSGTFMTFEPVMVFYVQ